jgi:FAD/FMN-containing dehydrogenase
MVSDDFLGQLADHVGADHVLVDPDLRASYERDWTGRWQGQCLAVVRPASTAQVSAVLRTCAARGVSVVPQGGNTGLVGGATPRGSRPQIILSSLRLSTIEDVDRTTGQLTVGAGVPLAKLQSVARAAGFDAGLDLGARGAATVGGIAACDAGGLQALRYGTARRRIAGIEAVLADGSVITRLNGLPKDNAGYDLPGLLIGSEGTLGFFTRVRWSCVDAQVARATALLALDSVAQAAAIASALRWSLPDLEMLEFLTEAGITLVRDRLSVSLPMPLSPVWVLLECAAREDPSEGMLKTLSELGADERSAVAVDSTGRQRLLRFRESLPEVINREGICHKLDVGVPLARLAGFYDQLQRLVWHQAPGARLIVFGHLGDGNLHINICGLPPEDQTIDAAVLKLVAEHGGTISAEHGVGVLKTRFLSLVRSPDDLRAMRLVKHALDPGWILNPNVILHADPLDPSA